MKSLKEPPSQIDWNELRKEFHAGDAERKERERQLTERFEEMRKAGWTSEKWKAALADYCNQKPQDNAETPETEGL